MPTTYQYTVRDRAGQVSSGSVVAENPPAAAAFLRDKGYYVTSIKQAKQQQTTLAQAFEQLQQISAKDLAIFCRQFATMVDAGLPLVSCLNVLIEQTQKAKLKDALQGVYKKVQEGESLAGALQSYSSVFPKIMVSMIDAGEVGGVLDVVLNRLAIHFEKEHKVNEKVKSAMVYPAVVIFMAALSVSFILVFVLPTFLKLFDNMKIQLPLPTRILLSFSDILKNYWFIGILAIIAAVVGWNYLMRRKQYQSIRDRFLLQVPVFGDLFRKIAVARFSRTFGTLVQSGVPIISALDVVKQTAGNINIEEALERAQKSVTEGARLAVTLAGSKVFTPMVIQMIAIGEESGQLDKMLEKIAEFYENEVDETVGRLSTLMEPFLIAILGIVIGLIVISIALPLFDVVTNFGRI